MRYELTTAHFIHNTLYPAGTVIDYDGEPNASMRPLDDEADRRLDEYYKARPETSLNPVKDLPMTMVRVVQPEKSDNSVVRIKDAGPVKSVLDDPTPPLGSPEAKRVVEATGKPLGLASAPAPKATVAVGAPSSKVSAEPKLTDDPSKTTGATANDGKGK